MLLEQAFRFWFQTSAGIFFYFTREKKERKKDPGIPSASLASLWFRGIGVRLWNAAMVLYCVLVACIPCAHTQHIPVL